MRTTEFQQQQQQQLQHNHLQFQPQKQYQQRKEAQISMKSHEQRDLSKTHRTQITEQDELFNDVQQNYHHHQTLHTEGISTQRKRSKTSFLQNLDIETAKSYNTIKQNEDQQKQGFNYQNSRTNVPNPTSSSCRNSAFSPQLETQQQQQQNNHFVETEEFKRYRNLIDNRSKASKSQIISNTQNGIVIGNQIERNQDSSTFYKEKAQLQIVLPHQSIEGMMSFGLQQEQKQKQQQHQPQHQHSTQQLQTARSTSNLQEIPQTNRNNVTNSNMREDSYHHKLAKTKSQRDNVKYQSIHFQNEQVSQNKILEKGNYSKSKSIQQQSERMHTQPEHSFQREDGFIEQPPRQPQYQEQIYQQNSFRQQQSKLQRKSCILDQYRSEQIQQQYTQRQQTNNKYDQQEQYLQQLNHTINIQNISDDKNRAHKNQQNASQPQNIFESFNQNSNIQQKNTQQIPDNVFKQQTERNHSSSSNNLQNQQQQQQNLLSHRQHGDYKSTSQLLNKGTEQNDYNKQQQVEVKNQEKNVQKNINKIQTTSTNLQQIASQDQDKQYKEQITSQKEQIQQLQTHNRQLLSQIKILESDNSNQIQKMKQLQEEIHIQEQNLQQSNHGKEQAIIQYQKILEQFQKLEEEVRMIREQSTKFAQERYQNQQQQHSIDLRNWTSQNNYSFDETSSSPFSMNNFASAKSAATTTTVFSQKSSTCMTKPHTNQQNIQQVQGEKQQQTLNQHHLQQISPQQQQQFINFQNQLHNNTSQIQQIAKDNNVITARDGTSIFEQTFSQDDQHQLHSQESKKSMMMLKKMDNLENQLSSHGTRNENIPNTAAFDILYSIYQKFGDGQVDQLDQLPEKISNLILENKLNGKFIKSMKELMMKCAPTNYFESTEPSLKIVWKFIKRVMEEYTILKSKSKQMGEQLSKKSSQQGNSSSSPISQESTNTQNTNKSFSNCCNNNSLQSKINSNDIATSSDQNVNTSNFCNKYSTSATHPEKTIQVICNELEISLEQQIIPKIYQMKNSISKINECIEFISSNQNVNMKSAEEIQHYILMLFKAPAQAITSNE